jgi:hypothetical protein
MTIQKKICYEKKEKDFNGGTSSHIWGLAYPYSYISANKIVIQLNNEILVQIRISVEFLLCQTKTMNFITDQYAYQLKNIEEIY